MKKKAPRKKITTIEGLASLMVDGFGRVNQRFDRVEQRFTSLEARRAEEFASVRVELREMRALQARVARIESR